MRIRPLVIELLRGYNNTMFRTQDLRVKEIVRLQAPGKLKAEMPISETASETVARSREAVTRVLQQRGTPAFGRGRPVSSYSTMRRAR